MRSRPGSRGKSHLQPCIAEILRTCIYPQNLVLRVEKILEEETEEPRVDTDQLKLDAAPHKRCNRICKLYLGDGERMIQAVIAPHLHALIELQETTEGSLIELRNYKVRKAKRLRQKGEVIYLAVDDYVCIILSRPTTSEGHEDVLVHGGGFLLDEEADAPSPAINIAPGTPLSQDGFETSKADPDTVQKRQALHTMSGNVGPKRKRENEEDSPPPRRRRSELDAVTSSQECDGFETVDVNLETVRKRRLALHAMSARSRQKTHPLEEIEGSVATPTKHSKVQGAGAMSSSDEPASTEASTAPAPQQHSDPAPALRVEPALLATPSHLQPSPTYYPLRSLLYPPAPLPPKNHPVTVFAVISWISPALVSRPGFPPKRHLKLHDSSISDRQVGVSISVFIDAASFTPRHGSVALFRGVVMQRHREEVILNAYPALRGTPWFVDDSEELEGLGWDVQGLRGWWEGRKQDRTRGKLNEEMGREVR